MSDRSPLRTDALIIGTGFGGAAPALRLAQAGLRVHLLERGPRIGIGDFRQTQDPRYLTRFLKGLSGNGLHLTWAEALGGGSGFYEMVSLRAPRLAFDQADRAGRRLWPAGLDRPSLDSWYDLAESMLRVEQIAVHEIPKSGLVFALLMKNLGLSCDRARYAVRGCLGSGFCVSGCIYGAKQSLHLNYLPQAEAAGATIECGMTALQIRTTAGRRSQDGTIDRLPHRYEVIAQHESGGRRRYLTRILILAGGTAGTAALLLRSRLFLPHLSPAAGRHIALNGSVKVAGLLPEGFPDGDMFAGRSHPGMISYHFLESHGITISAVKAMPIQAVTAARLRLDGDEREPVWWGQPYAELMRRFRHRVIALVALGMTPPGSELTLGHDGSPVIRLGPEAELARYQRRTAAVLRDILVRNGCRLIHTDWLDWKGEPKPGLFFSTAHQTGSARMADDWDQGVADQSGEVFRYPGLYVSDGSAIPSSLGVNTSLTILANAERIAAGILARHGLVSATAPPAAAAGSGA
jgi:choline dehydrogenase-like flavoprotein